MTNALYEAQKAAASFLQAIVTRRDRCFAISFSDRPVLLMPPTNDVDAVSHSLDGLAAVGFTALHDALVHSLYYFRGVRGRKALVVLSDGDDTASNISFNEALEYARHSGVVIYTIGLDVGTLDLGIRNKLKSLASETGGRTFFINQSAELAGVYSAIEKELRSQYLLAYTSDRGTESGVFRQVEVKMTKRGMKARTVRGYYE
jgi:Ca-activated chloride channel homolog